MKPAWIQVSTMCLFASLTTLSVAHPTQDLARSWADKAQMDTQSGNTVVSEEKLAIVILTNWVHPNRDGNSAALRAKIASVTAAAITQSYNND